MRKPPDMIARIDWNTDTPTARIKNDAWKNRLISTIDDRTADILSDAVNGKVRIDRLLVLFQQLQDPSSIYAQDLVLTKVTLHSITASWSKTIEMYTSLWWEVAPICFVGRVKVKVKSVSYEVHATAEDGDEVEGVLGLWLVDKGHVCTMVGERLVKIELQLLVRCPMLIKFFPPV